MGEGGGKISEDGKVLCKKSEQGFEEIDTAENKSLTNLTKSVNSKKEQCEFTKGTVHVFFIRNLARA